MKYIYLKNSNKNSYHSDNFCWDFSLWFAEHVIRNNCIVSDIRRQVCWSNRLNFVLISFWLNSRIWRSRLSSVKCVKILLNQNLVIKLCAVIVTIDLLILIAQAWRRPSCNALNWKTNSKFLLYALWGWTEDSSKSSFTAGRTDCRLKDFSYCTAQTWQRLSCNVSSGKLNSKNSSVRTVRMDWGFLHR